MADSVGNLRSEPSLVILSEQSAAIAQQSATIALMTTIIIIIPKSTFQMGFKTSKIIKIDPIATENDKNEKVRFFLTGF